MAAIQDNQREKDIFERALDLDSFEERLGYAKGACADDAALLARVQALLLSHHEATRFLPDASRVQEGAPLIPKAPLDECLGALIGRYKLLQRIGEGGCGVVYMAEQEQPVRRRVALKVIKLGMDTKSVIARFEAERQALAMMDHPNIAKVLDAGATDAGRPYFVMELVRGVKITEYCDEARLSTRDRLDLFIKVCQAIQHAHQKGIIHRDIKPSNILVTINDGIAVPKVIDFGIAKATEERLTEKTLFTQFEALIGTPAYMSPEQAVMTSLDVDTRSDIYSLGVLLYELLAGSTPFDAKELMASGIDAMRKTIREKEPVRPSTRLSQTFVGADVRRLKSPPSGTPRSEEEVSASSRRLLQLKETMALLRGDLDWIVMKCLEKDRARRYETANGLASDLQRHLNNEAVLARPPSRAYCAHKFVIRNKLAVAAVASIAAVLVLGVTVSAWMAVRATRSGNVAKAARENEAKQRLSADEARRRAEARELVARQRAYTSDMNLALQAWEEGNLGRAQRLLGTSRPESGQVDVRGFEWRYLWKLCQDESRLTVSNFAGGINWAAYSADGTSLILAGGSKLKSLEIATHREELLLEDTEGIWLPTFSPRATNIVAAASDKHKIKLWDLGTKGLLTTFSGHSTNLSRIAISPDGTTLASASGDGTVKLWDIASRNRDPRTLTRYSQAALNLAFSPDGKYLVTSGSTSEKERPIRLFDVQSGEQVASHFEGHTSWVYALAFSRDGQLLASAGGEGLIFIWDFATRNLLYTMPGHGGNIYALAFSSDGQRLISGGADNTIRVWDLSARRQAFFRRGHRSTVSSLAISPDDKSIVSVAGNGVESQVKIWELSLPKERDILPASRSVFDLALSPDDKTLALVGYDDMAVESWDVPSRQRLDTLGGAKSLLRVAFSRDGALLATGELDGAVRLWDFQKRELNAVLRNEFPVMAISFSPDGRTLATAGLGLEFWDVASGRRLAGLEGKTDGVSAVEFSPDARRVATGDKNGHVVVWDWPSRKPQRAFKPHAAEVRRVAFTPNGALLASCSLDSTVVLFDVTALQVIDPPLRGHMAWVSSLDFTPDGRSLASTGYDGTIKLWNVATRQLILTLKGHPGAVHRVVFSRDGNLMATGGADGKVRLWPAATFAETDVVEQANPFPGKL